MPKKPLPASAEDLEAAQAEFRAAIAQTKNEIAQACNGVEAKMGPKLEDLLTKCSTACAEGDQRVDQTLRVFSEEIVAKAAQDLGQRMVKCDSALETQISNLDARLTPVEERVMRALHEALPPIEAKFEQRLEELRKQLEEASAARLEKQTLENESIYRRITEEAGKSAERLEQARAPLTQNLVTLEESMHKKNTQQDETVDQLKKDLASSSFNLGERLEALRLSAEEQIAGVDQQSRTSLQTLTADTDNRLAEVDTFAQSLRRCLAENENLPTKRVEWTIRNVGARLRPWDTAKASLHTNWLSPRFDASGMHDLQLELQLYRPTDLDVEGQESGDCSIYLWACKGATVTFRLYIGTKTATFEKVFNGRVPYGAKRLCFLSDEINKEEDVLRVGVEFLEVRRDVEVVVGENPEEEPLEGSLVYQRNINNRLLEQVEGHVDNMRSQLVRRIEWRISHADLLQKTFQPGQPICSPMFVAAGIENMQLVFYPNGYADATANYCSIFLFAPAGATLQALLCAGKLKQKLNHSFEMASAFGRTNFARFDAVVEPDNTIIVALEIKQAFQDMKAVKHHSPLAGDVRESSAGHKGVESVLKLQRCTNESNLQNVRHLPSLWTAKPEAELAAVPDGFHNFAEIRERDNEKAARVRAKNGPKRSESTPLLLGGTAPLQPPLPTVGAPWKTKPARLSPLTQTT